MNNLRFQLSSVLLAALVVPVIMTFQIYPGDTNFFQFGLIFLFIFFNFLLDILKLPEKRYYLLKYIVLFTLIFLSIGGAFISAIVVRHKIAPIFQVHDIILQQEAAIRFFLDGINPWAATYEKTFMAAWHYHDTLVNPALYHFVMMPFYLLFSLPFYLISNHTIGYFDGRLPLYLLFLSVLVMGFKLVKDRDQKILFVTLLAFNPAMFAYTLEGRSDYFMFSFLFAALYLLHKNKFALGGILMAMAFAVKQSVWPLLPLYLGYVYFLSGSIRVTLRRTVAFFATLIILVAPFVLWDPKSFLASTVLYLSGNTLHSYPISGYGLGALLHQMGVIENLQSPYPFIIWQAIFITPLLIFCLILLKKYPTIKMMLFTYGLLALVYWYLSRYFNNSHMGYLTMVFITAYFWPDNVESDKKISKTTSK